MLFDAEPPDHVLCYFMQDHQTWYGNIASHGNVSGTITRSLWLISYLFRTSK